MRQLVEEEARTVDPVRLQYLRSQFKQSFGPGPVGLNPNILNPADFELSDMVGIQDPRVGGEGVRIIYCSLFCSEQNDPIWCLVFAARSRGLHGWAGRA